MSEKPFNPRTGTPSPETKDTQNRILEMYRDNPNFAAIARELGYSETYVKKLYKKALKSIIVDNVESHRKLELMRLDKLHQKAMEVLEAFHPMVSAGQVVRDILENQDGSPVLDEDGNPVRIKLADQAPLLAAIDRVLKVQERRAKLLGLDAPTKTALTDPSGEKEASFVQFYLPDNGRDNGSNTEG